VEAEGGDLRPPHFKTQNLFGKTVPTSLPLKSGEVNEASFEKYLDQHMREYLKAALDLYGGDTLALSKALNLSRATIYNKMNRLGIRSETS
jgi:DNA-binding NtrC family response regulator